MNRNKFFYEVNPWTKNNLYRSQAYIVVGTQKNQDSFQFVHTCAKLLMNQLAQSKLSLAVNNNSLRPDANRLSLLKSSTLREIVLEENPKGKHFISNDYNGKRNAYFRFDVVSSASPKRLESRLLDAGFVKGIPQDYFI